MLVERDRAVRDTKYGPKEGREPLVSVLISNKITVVNMKVNIKEIGLTIEDKLWNWRASHGGSEQDDMAVASRTYL